MKKATTLENLSFLLILVFLTVLSAPQVRAQDNQWQVCLNGLEYHQQETTPSQIRLADRFGRDITYSDMPILDWEGFIENPQFRFSLIAPENLVYPLKIDIRAVNAPRLYIYQRHQGEHPFDVRNFLSVHNETGPAWGWELRTLSDETTIYGGVPHDLTHAELTEIGLRRDDRYFEAEQFPLNLELGIHPDRDGENEAYQLDITVTDMQGQQVKHSVDVIICDQDQPERPVEFQFHIDYSKDWDGYLENTVDGQVVVEGFERILDDVAYFFQDMTFDTIEEGQCQAFVNWTVDNQPGYASNSKAYNNGYYLFIASHSGGGGLSSQTRHTRNDEPTDFPACGFWGANPRDQLSTNVNTRIYVPEDDWWRTTSHMIYGRDGECLGDSLGDPGNGCIECPEDQKWCGHLRGDIYWPNLHELNHGLTMSDDWPKWKEWFDSETLCVDDEALTRQVGTCLPMYKTDHVVTQGMSTESNKQSDFGRTLFRRYDILLMQAVGWELRETSMFMDFEIASSDLSDGQLAQEFRETIKINGGIPGYHFEILQGHLPPGLTLNQFNGQITGTPTIAGEYTFKLKVTDSDQYNVLRQGGDTKELRISIND